MIRNWFTVALRNLVKHRLYSAINIIGLAIGLASCIVIILFVRDELSYDRWIPNAERIYRVHTHIELPGRPPINTDASSALALAALRKDNEGQVETGVRVASSAATIRRGAEAYFERGMAVDSTFLQVFDLPLIAGDKARALQSPTSMVISKSLARKYFGDRNAIGETLAVASPLITRDFRVDAVMDDLPLNTHMRTSSFGLDFILPMADSDLTRGGYLLWGNQNLVTYLKLKRSADAAAITDDLEAFSKRHVPDSPPIVRNAFSIMAVPQIHLQWFGNAAMVNAFIAVAALILLIASINFMNLATARSTQRVREVALRKVLGAHRRHLVAQFVGESVLISSIALVLALSIVELVLPAFGAILGTSLTLSYWGVDTLVPYALALVGAVALLGGTYPAFYISRFEPARLLKSNTIAPARRRVSVRTLLVVAQFAISIALIVCTAVVYAQTRHLNTMDLGFRREGLLVLRRMNVPEVAPSANTVKQEILKIPGVTHAAFSGVVPTDGQNRETSARRAGTPESDNGATNVRAIDFGFAETYGIEVLAGRLLSEDFAGDDFTGTSAEKAARGGNILLNRRALPQFGFKSPEEAVGAQLAVNAGNNLYATVTIVGVVGDVQFRSARNEMPPTMFFRDANTGFGPGFESLTVRFEGMTASDARAALEQVWRRVLPGVPMRSDLMSELVDRQYRTEQVQSAMFTAFAVLAIVVACLGLYGLAAFTAERRTKEIGLRKVVGAHVPDVARLLVWQFSKPVMVANLIAWPVAYIVMRDWLNGFTFRIELSALYFIAAGVGALLIAWATTIFHAVRAGRANPIHALKFE